MDNFEILKHYTIPSDVLMDMLSTYRLLGMNLEYEEKIKDQAKYLRNEVIEKDTFFLANLIGVDITDNRLRLLITKNSLPKNKEEQMVVGIKKVVNMIYDKATNHLFFNGSDILDCLNLIYGKTTIKFSNAILENKVSLRLNYERILEKYQDWFKNDKFEHIFLSVIVFMEMVNLKPYSNHNELAAILSLYYMILLSDVISIHYVSFFETYTTFKNKIDTAVAKGSINYQDNYLKTTDTVRLVFELIAQTYSTLQEMIKKLTQQERAFKSDVIEVTILQKMPVYFTKDDIRRIHPNASDSTINRILFKLRDEQIIMPLGKGRSARWMKIISENDPRLIFGLNYENKD